MRIQRQKKKKPSTGLPFGKRCCTIPQDMKSVIKQTLKLKGSTAVFIDWANVWGWRDVLEKPLDAKLLYKYLKSYPQIESLNFYFGTDNNPESQDFLEDARKIGFNVVTKSVKYILLGQVGEQLIRKRKCDFDIEICMSVYKALEEGIKSFIFFSGDGDFAPLYRYLIGKGKQVIVIYAKKHVGREIWEIEESLFKIQVDQLEI